MNARNVMKAMDERGVYFPFFTKQVRMPVVDDDSWSKRAAERVYRRVSIMSGRKHGFMRRPFRC